LAGAVKMSIVENGTVYQIIRSKPNVIVIAYIVGRIAIMRFVVRDVKESVF
jgi:hypothetical protein